VTFSTCICKLYKSRASNADLDYSQTNIDHLFKNHFSGNVVFSWGNDRSAITSQHVLLSVLLTGENMSNNLKPKSSFQVNDATQSWYLEADQFDAFSISMQESER
jgi:hypothetical protein